MIELDNPECSELLLGLPLNQNDFGGVSGWFRPSLDGTTYVLSNRKVSFTLVADEYGGLRLTTFQRIGEQVWTNREPYLWRVILYDTTIATAAASGNTSILQPEASRLTSITETEVAGRQTLTASWTQVSVGNVDSLNVTVTLSIGDDDDWLQVKIACAWVGTPTRYAIDSICWLPLRVAPLNRGDDYAVVPAQFGFLSKDPITYLRYDPADGKSRFGFQNCIRNYHQYPSGRGWSMGFWGYYETVSSAGWMVWAENGGYEFFHGCFQSDGADMNWEMYQAQEDNVLVGNNGRTLGSSYSFCLRPLQITQAHGWWDIGSFYRQRFDATRPPFWVPNRPDNGRLSPIERAPWLFLGIDYGSRYGSFDHLVDYVASVRTAVGDSSAVIHGVGDIPGIYPPYEDESPGSNAREVLARLYDQRTFLAAWVPGEFTPVAWDVRRWKGGELRFHTTYDQLGSYRMTRKGFLNGGGADDLATTYRERTYGISTWLSSNPTFRLTVTGGQPSTDGFSLTGLSAVLVPASPAARLATAPVVSLTSTRINCSTDFYDATGAIVVPTAADTVVLMNGGLAGNTTLPQCPHAILGSSVFLRAVEDASAGGRFETGRSCGIYNDVYDEPLQSQPIGPHGISCYRDHTGWSKIDPDYVQHPLGGGAWYRRARHDYIAALRADVRARQSALGRQQTYWTACEDLSESTLDIYDYCLHVISTGAEWRTPGTDPENEKYLAIPLFAVAHAGRALCYAPGGIGGFTNGALLSDSPFPGFPSPQTDDDLHRVMAYELAIEWPYGITPPRLSFYADDDLTGGEPAGDPWDDSFYQPTGPVAVKVRQVRDLWTQLAVAEKQWALTYLRYGEFLPPAVVDLDVSTTVQSEIRRANPYLTQYHSFDVLYPGDTCPAVVHGVWRDPKTGKVCLLFVNWTEQTATWAGLVSMAACGFSGAAEVTVERVDYRGAAATQASLTDLSESETLTVENIRPFSMTALVLTLAETPATPTSEPRTTMPMRKSTIGLHLAGSDGQQSVWLGANVGYRTAYRELGLTSQGLAVVGYVWHKTDSGRSNTLWEMSNFVVPENVGIGNSNGPVTVQYVYSNSDLDVADVDDRALLVPQLSAEQDQTGLRDDDVQAGRYRYLVFVLRSQGADSFISEWGVSQAIYAPISVGGITLALKVDNVPSPGRFNIQRGTTPTLTFLLVNSDDTAFDATGGTLQLSLAKTAAQAQLDGAPLVGPVEASPDVDLTTGTFEWIPDATDTDQTPGEYVFEALWSRGSERARWSFSVEIEQSVTSAAT